jgi:transposase
MEVLYSQCCGLDVHKASVTACCRWLDRAGHPQKEIRRFGTYTSELLDLAQWLQQHQVEQVGMESTGSYWRPVWNVLESQGLRLLLANAQHIKNVPGRKTDTLDPEWISDLLMHGLIKPSFVPDQQMRDLRDLTRMRSKVVQDHTRVANRIQAVLEDANIKLGNVVSNILGMSSRAMLQGLIKGRPPGELAELALGKLRVKLEQLGKALEGHFRPEHGFLLQRMLMQTRFLEQQERALRRQIDRRLDTPARHAVALWDTIPGVNQAIAWVLAAEMGTRVEQFPDAHHAASWAAICPGNNESGGKRRSGKIRKGNPWLRAALCEAAWSASRSKGTYLAALYRRMAGRKGHKRAIVAVAHAILIIAYQMLKDNQPYRELGESYFDDIKPEKTVDRLVRRLQKMGYHVLIEKSVAGQQLPGARFRFFVPIR